MARATHHGPGRIYGTPHELGEATAVLMVALLTRKFGRPPSWSEFGDAMGWKRSQVDARVRELRHVGVRWLSGREHSLNVTGEAVAQSLMLVRQAREQETAA